MDNSNPFSNLVRNLSPQEQQHEKKEIDKVNCEEKQGTAANCELITLMEEVFLFSFNPDTNKYLYLEDFGSQIKSSEEMTVELVGRALFDRLFQVSSESSIPTTDATDPSIIPYLFGCYKRVELAEKRGKDKRIATSFQNMILSNAFTALKIPYIFEGNDISEEVYALLQNSFDPLFNGRDSSVCAFFKDIVEMFQVEDKTNYKSGLCEAFFPLLDLTKDKLKKEGSLTKNNEFWQILLFFAVNKELGEVLILHSTPSSENGREFEDTLLGLLFTISCIPKTDLGPFEYFDRPADQPPQTTEFTMKYIWTSLSSLHSNLKDLFYNLLKYCRNPVLNWLGSCVEKNIDKGKLWNHTAQELLPRNYVSDAFMLNFSAVLLHLSNPIVTSNEKLAKVDPEYCSVNTENRDVAHEKGVHLIGIENETCFLPRPKDFVTSALKFGVSSDLFFIAHKSLDLSTRLLHEKLAKLSQELNKLERAWQELQNAGGTSPYGIEIKERMNMRMSLYLSLRAAMTEPKFCESLMQFMTGSSKWACQISANKKCWDDVDDITILSEENGLPFIPEFVATNICDTILFQRRFNALRIEETNDDLRYIFDFILVFMGSKERMKNPHLRAKLAELCENILPQDEDRSSVRFYREKLFKQYKRRKLLAESLLKCFVSIEMTGEGVAFEQKFNYKRPMYVVMEYMWSLEDHKNVFKKLAVDAIKNIEATDAPLFLRFLNLLMNDAIYLLDEALSYMSQVREQQKERGDGSWAGVPVFQRPEREATFQHITMLARFHNHLGLATIKMLSILTTEIKDIFYTSVLVDRIASMLNYFLLHLVGPKNREFKVKDFEKYEFKPAEMVTCICQIYVNLGENDNFCFAVSADGRSYSSSLFQQAGNVLRKIGQHSLVTKLDQVATHIKQASEQLKTDDEIVTLAPDEYLDPIMSTLMLDPVMLPSSKNIVDKSTIARHLLSDQSDPFNREPLTLDQVIPCPALKLEIHDWLEEQKKKTEKSTNK